MRPDFQRARDVVMKEADRLRTNPMKFEFRSHVQLCVGPAVKPALGIRGARLHALAVADAAERFIHERLLRKRARTLRA